MAETSNNNEQGWLKQQVYVLQELKRLGASIDGISEKLTIMRLDITKLNMKSGIWGAVAGMLPAIAILLFILLRG